MSLDLEQLWPLLRQLLILIFGGGAVYAAWPTLQPILVGKKKTGEGGSTEEESGEPPAVPTGPGELPPDGVKQYLQRIEEVAPHATADDLWAYAIKATTVYDVAVEEAKLATNRNKKEGAKK